MVHRFTRRTFIKGAALTAGGLMAETVLRGGNGGSAHAQGVGGIYGLPPNYPLPVGFPVGRGVARTRVAVRASDLTKAAFDWPPGRAAAFAMARLASMLSVWLTSKERVARESTSPGALAVSGRASSPP